jgi:hypothetical protein
MSFSPKEAEEMSQSRKRSARGACHVVLHHGCEILADMISFHSSWSDVFIQVL